MSEQPIPGADEPLLRDYFDAAESAPYVVTEKTLDERISDLEIQVRLTNATLGEMLTIVAEVKESVGPMIENLASHPMFKMFAGKGGK